MKENKVVQLFVDASFMIDVVFIICRLKPIDINVMKALHNKVNIVPVIAKADTLTKKEVRELKSRVRIV